MSVFGDFGITPAQAAAIAGGVMRAAPLLPGEYDAPTIISSGNAAVAANTHYACPFIPRSTFVSDRGCLRVSTGAAGLCKLGIYAADPATKLPSTKLAEASTDIDTTSIALLEIGWLANPTLEVGRLYWLTSVFNATPTMLCWNHNTAQAGGFQTQVGYTTLASALSGTPVGRYSVALTYGAAATPFLPASFGAGAYSSGLPGSPIIALRAA